MAISAADVARVAGTISSLQPQLAIIMTAVRGGYMAYTAIRAVFKDAGHDDAVLDGIVAECDRHIAMWQNAKF